MPNTHRFIFLVLLLPALISATNADDLKRSEFPDGFIFGVSTSSYQIEGGYLEDGKGISNWDDFSRLKGSIENGENGYVADDHYHRYLEDIENMHFLGVNAYRFSISWSRVLPRGRFGEVNPAGITFYNNIIDNLLIRGITPFVTLYHHEIPQELEERYGAWLSPLIQEDFLHFARVCFENFGDRVKYWVTVNEPNLFTAFAYKWGMYPPARCSPPFGNCTRGNSDVEPLITTHNMILAHAKAANLYRERFQPKQGGQIGIVESAMMFEPLTDDEHDKEAMLRALAFHNAWVLDPLVFGDYPPEMRKYHGTELPQFTSEERLLIRDSIDFIGINHYGSLYVRDCLYSSCVCVGSSCTTGGDRAIEGFAYFTGEKNGVLIGEMTGVDQCFVVPRGMEETVDYIKWRYPNKPIYVTENGYSSPDKETQLTDLLHDVKRIDYHKKYLAHLAKAIRRGADVRGYFIWSLLDSFEWTSGYSTRFGLYHVNRTTLERTPKMSAKWYKDFLGGQSLDYRQVRSTISVKQKKDVSAFKL